MPSRSELRAACGGVLYPLDVSKGQPSFFRSQNVAGPNGPTPGYMVHGALKNVKHVGKKVGWYPRPSSLQLGVRCREM